jgi:hypothetical protein
MNPISVLKARAEARALLFQTGEYVDLGEAITPLLVYAHERDLDEELGAVAVMAIIKVAFGDNWVELGGG